MSAALLRADARALPIADGAADVVLCCLGLQFIEDKARCLREMRRVLRPGGSFLGAAPAMGLDPRYDRRHAARKRKDFPLNERSFAEELAASGFADARLSTSGALVLWEVKAASEPLARSAR
jgi:SAM-dependent methyltransferase